MIHVRITDVCNDYIIPGIFPVVFIFSSFFRIPICDSKQFILMRLISQNTAIAKKRWLSFLLVGRLRGPRETFPTLVLLFIRIP